MSLRSLARCLVEWSATLSRSPAGTPPLRKSNKPARISRALHPRRDVMVGRLEGQHHDGDRAVCPTGVVGVLRGFMHDFEALALAAKQANDPAYTKYAKIAAEIATKGCGFRKPAIDCACTHPRSGRGQLRRHQRRGRLCSSCRSSIRRRGASRRCSKPHPLPTTQPRLQPMLLAAITPGRPGVKMR